MQSKEEKERLRKRQWKLDNPLKVKLSGQLYYRKNKEKIRKRHKEWAKANFEKRAAIDKKYSKNNFKKRKAKNTINDGVRRKGSKIIPQPCSICGKAKAHAHHSDYNKPLDVQWFCPQHHKAWHRIFLAEQ